MDKNAVLDALVSAVLAKAKEQSGGGLGGPYYRASPGNPSNPYYSGPGGLFGVLGLERDIISTRIQPMGLADQLPVLPTTIMHPYFPYFTGFLPDTGVEPNGVCDDPPTAGPGKSCIQTAQFGRFSRQTRTLEINRLGQQINRGEFQDLRFMNDPLLGGMGGITVPGSIGGGGDVRREVMMRFLEVGVSFQNWMARKIYEGNPANNMAGGGYEEFPGLDILIGTNKVDALTGTLCPSLNSDIKDFNYGNIGVPGTGDSAIVNVLSYMMRYLRYNAEHMNFGSTSWVFVMRPAAFWELTAAWPCAYMTYRCQVNGTPDNGAFVDATEMVRMRDDMRNNNYILIDGIRYPVILDSMIREETNTQTVRVPNGSFASDIYIIPMTVRGGQPVTYWETFDYRESLRIAGDGNLATQFFWSDGGRYLWHFKPPNNFCIQWLAKIEPRLILRTPQLAGRLTNVLYRPLQHERDVINTDPYFVDGGVSGRGSQALYSDWNLTVPA